MKMRGIYVKVKEDVLKEFTKVARSLGLSKSEAFRKAMENFITTSSGETMTAKMRGIVKSRLTLKELEEAYLVSKF
ncbi:MAG: ribbon-helix-helix protein, CopG family [Candidatus Methanomethylicia archaeon]